MIPKSTLLAGLFGALALLAGCSTIVPVESEVQSFLGAAGAPATGGTFRFERLPSQQKDQVQATKMEALAQPAMEKAGFRRDDASAQFSVQIGAYSTEVVPLPAYMTGPGARFFYPGFDRFYFYHHPFAYTGTPGPIYISGVTVVIREVGTGRVVYETNASNEQRWFDPDKVFAPMFEAAMKDYPAAPDKPRNISINVNKATK
jgi:hypothetical protein